MQRPVAQGTPGGEGTDTLGLLQPCFALSVSGNPQRWITVEYLQTYPWEFSIETVSARFSTKKVHHQSRVFGTLGQNRN